MDNEEFDGVLASIFADPEDLRRYKEAIASGASEEEALRVGDNGIGFKGDDTTSLDDPIVALPPDTPGFAYNRKVLVEGPDGTTIARIADKMGKMGKAKIDLNPAAAMAVGHSGGLTPVKWSWADEDVSNVGNPSSIALAGGDLSSSNLANVQLPGLAGISGVNRLTPIGDESYEEEALDGGGPSSISDASIPGAEDLVTGGGISGASLVVPEAAPPPPSSQGYSFQGVNSDGSKRMASGTNIVDIYPPDSSGNSAIKYTIGDRAYYKAGRYAKPVDISSQYKEVDRVDPKTNQIRRYQQNTRNPNDVIDRGLSPNDPSIKKSASENALDRALIKRGKNPIDMTPEEKTKALEITAPLTPSEKLAVRRDERKAFQDNQATIAMYGKGQMPGLHQIKTKLDSIMGSAGGDFKKLSPQQLATFVFQFSKFNDPNSAVLLGEYQAAASRLGLADRAQLAINKAMQGDPITPEQAEDIHKTISTVYDTFKKEHYEDLSEREEVLEGTGISLRALGVPPSIEKEYKKMKEEGQIGNKASEKETAAPAKPSASSEKVHVKNKDGQTGWIPANELEAARAQGYIQIP